MAPRIANAPIEIYFGGYGHWLRHKLLECILSGTDLIVKFQSIESDLLTGLMKLFTFLGSEETISGIVLISLWVIDYKFGVLFTFVFSSCFYIASFFKNLFCLPRPAVPPVKLMGPETLDWALPSSHSLVAFLIPFFTFHYAISHNVVSTPVTVVLFLLSLTWCIGVCSSRVYLGVHNVVDVVASILIGAPVLWLYCNYADWWYDQWSTVPSASITVICTYLFLFYIHPRCVPETESYAETIGVTSCGLGVILSLCWRHYFPTTANADLLHDVGFSHTSLRYFIFVALARLIYGGLIVTFGLHLALKPIFRYAIGKFCNRTGMKSHVFSRALKENRELCPTKFYGPDYLLSDPVETDCLMCLKMYKKYLASDHSPEDHTMTVNPKFNDLPYDINVATRFLVYILTMWFIGGPACNSFEYLGLTL